MERSQELIDLVEKAQIYLRSCQSQLEEEFQLGNWPRYDWNQDEAQLVFSKEGVPRVVAEIQFVGSISTQSDTWMWSWGNDTIDGALAKSAAAVRAYGERNNLPQLITRLWHAHEVDGWEMTCITAFLTKAKGAYRSPSDDSFTFMVFTDVKWAA
jgi:hypothetical protein